MSFFAEYKQVLEVLQEKHQLAFYAESRHYYQYFEKLIHDLLATSEARICYITSDPFDPLLSKAPANLKVVCVKWMAGFLFRRIRSDVMIMTMPDLDNFLFKRSAGVATYIYMFHAAVSTHQQYRKSAFFNYDTIFCIGDYHAKEIRMAEKLYGKKQKELIAYGYPLIDAIKKKTASIDTTKEKQTILVAPSWFEGCIFDTCIDELLTQLSKLPYQVVLRSHPEYEKRKKKKFRKILKLVNQYSNISLDELANVIDRLPAIEILITDRSGIAFEFAFGCRKPVLFIETAFKQAHPDWRELMITPVENHLRHELGLSVLPSQLDQLPEKIAAIKDFSKGFSDKMDQLGKSFFYNSDQSYKAGLDYLLSKVSKD